MINIDDCIDEFNNYISKFDMHNNKIKQRYEHTFRVMKNAEKIAKSLNLDDEDITLAKLIGLLHDIGRFHQLEKYNTINDKKTIDHASYGVDILFNDHYIEKYTTNKEYYSIIKKSIANHNKLTTEPNLTNREQLFVNIIRDADKIDILHIIERYHELNFKYDGITSKIKEDFYHNISIPYVDITTNSDRVFIYLCYIFDINFDYSFHYIKTNKLYNLIYDTLDNKLEYQEYFNYVYKYIDERMITC